MYWFPLNIKLKRKIKRTCFLERHCVWLRAVRGLWGHMKRKYIDIKNGWGGGGGSGGGGICSGGGGGSGGSGGDGGGVGGGGGDGGGGGGLWHSSPVLGLGLMFVRFWDLWCTGRGCQPLTQPSTWRTKSLFLWPPETGRTRYNPRHWVLWYLGGATSSALNNCKLLIDCC